MTTPSTDVFLSYSREDQATARRFAEAFEREGLTVWWDQTLRSGENYDQVTEAALREAKAVVVLWSKHSVDSRWVRAEATQADRNGTLVPVMIEPCNRPIMFELKHTAELAHWKGDAGDSAWRAFLGDVRQFVQKEASAISRAPVQSINAPPAQFGMRTLIGVVALLTLVAGVFWLAGRQTKVAPKPVETAAAISPDVAKEVTLAVLPFADMSPAHDQEYFSDGLTEELLNQLAQVKALRVTGRTSSFSFKGKNEDLRLIAERLGVVNLLEGSVRKDGKNLRITAQLINGKDGAHRWSKTYDRELSGVFALQEEISRDVTQALSITLDVGDLPRSRGGTTNIEAYDKFLRAGEVIRGGFQKGLSEAVTLLREAVALDPNFQTAWLALSGLLGPASGDMPGNAAARAQERATINAHIDALHLEGQLGLDFHARRSLENRDWAGAVSAATQLESDGILSSTILNSVGRVGDAIPYMQRLVQTDPLAYAYSASLVTALDAAGRTTEAQTELERGKALQGDAGEKEVSELIHRWSSPNHIPEVEHALFKSVLQRNGSDAGRIFPGLAHELGDAVASRASIHKAFDNPANQGWKTMLTISSVADTFGDRDLALTALHRAFIEMRGEWPPSLWGGHRTGLRADPRFKDILREMGLVDYFRASGNWGDFCKPVGTEDFECH